ncbi:MAG: hypothetical protein WC389_15595 [Lutibacter sp.]|jgi:hypothetical protein
MIITKKVRRKILRKYSCRACSIHHDNDIEILITNHTSLKVRLHEIYHALYNKEYKDFTPENFLEDELKADIYAYELCGKPLPIANILNETIELMDYLKPKNKLRITFNLTLQILHRNHYNLDDHQKSILWHNLKSYAKYGKLLTPFKNREPYLYVHKN